MKTQRFLFILISIKRVRVLYITHQAYYVARKRTTFRFPIDSNFRADWEDFIKHAESKRQTPSQLLQDVVLDYLDDTPLSIQQNNLIEAHDDNYTYKSIY